MKKTKILYVINSLRKAGPVVVLKNLIDNLDRDAFTPVIVKLTHDDPARTMTKDFLDDGIEIHELGFSKLQLECRVAKVSRRLSDVIKDVKPDIIHTHGYHPVRTMARLGGTIPVIETMHNICTDDYILGYGRLLGNYMVRNYLKALPKLTAGVAISETVKEFYRKRLPGFHVERVYNGIPFKTTNATKEELRKQLGLPSDRTLFIATGALSPRKDPMTVIDGYIKAFPDDNQAILVFLGQGNLPEQYAKIAESRSDIRLLGWQRNPLDYMKAADFAIAASLSEGFGLAYMEALSVETPVIATKIGAFNEFADCFPLMREYRFDVKNSDALADALRIAMKSRPDISDIAADVRNQFSARRMADGYMEIYSKLTK